MRQKYEIINDFSKMQINHQKNNKSSFIDVFLTKMKDNKQFCFLEIEFLIITVVFKIHARAHIYF